MLKLTCGIDLQKFDKQCGECRKCSAKSAVEYPFDKNLADSDSLVEQLISLMESETGLTCKKTERVKEPDIRVYRKDGTLACRVEAKQLDGKPFMKLRTMISGCDLLPKETIVLDIPKLKSYLSRSKTDGAAVPTFVVWRLHRPCADIGNIAVFQDLRELRRICVDKQKSRMYDRTPGAGDFDAAGRKWGVTEKYHFSISECRPIEELVFELKKLE